MIAMILSLAAATMGGQAGAADTAAATATAAATTASTPATASGAKPRAKRYCVHDTLTGSHLLRKVCKTRDEWLATGWDPLKP